MSECECLSACPFFNDRMQGVEDIAEILKDRMCHGDFTSCARYQVFKALGPGTVPEDLYPNQQSRVKDIIFQGQHK